MEIYGNRITGCTTEYYSATIEESARKNNPTPTGTISDVRDHIVRDSCEKTKYNWTCKK